MVQRSRERRQEATYNNLAHASVFGSLLFLPSLHDNDLFFSLSEISSRRVWPHFRQIDSLNNGHKTEVEKNAKTLLKF